jgi:EF-hand domain pair
MSMSVGASSNALSYLQQLLQQGTPGASGAAAASDPLSVLMQSLSGASVTSGQAAPVAAAAGGSCSSSFLPFGTSTMAALISLQGQSASGLTAQSPSQLFSKIDTDGDGKISQSEFETALTGAGASKADADALFAKLDANGDGSVTQSEMPGAKGAHGHHHHGHGGGGAGGATDSSSQNPLDALLSGAGADGATTQATTNADGSTTTTITYADGTKIDMTSPATAPSGATASANAADGTNGAANNAATGQSSANLLQQLIQLQSQLLTAAASTLSAIA